MTKAAKEQPKARAIRDDELFQGEDWHPEYERSGTREMLAQLEGLLNGVLGTWRRRIVARLEEGAGQAVEKAAAFAPGMILGLLDQTEWFRVEQAKLQEQVARILAKGANGTAKRQPASIRVRWDFVNDYVKIWAAARAAELVTQITDETRARIRAAVMDGIQSGASIPEIRSAIAEVGMPTWRAERIARTEVIRASSEGAAVSWASSGTVKGMKWLSGQNGACPECVALNGKVVALGQPFYVGRFGDGRPPRHPNCRCAIAPVLADEMVTVQVRNG